MKKLITLCLAIMLTGSASCQWGKRIKGNGNETTETREVGTYDEIHVSHIFKVELVPGSEGQITIEGEENLLEHTITKVSGNRLRITVEKGVQLQPSRNSDGIRVRIPVEDIREIGVSGAAAVKSSHEFSFPRIDIGVSGAADLEMALRSEDVTASGSGAAEIQLEGRAENLEFVGSGASKLRADDLEAKHVEVVVSGASDARVFASESLIANASGAGNVRYKGNPAKMEKKSGKASNVSKSK